MHSIISFLLGIKYVSIFLLCIVEGPLAMITGGFLLKAGVVSFFPIYLCMIAGDFVADSCWYAIGRFGAKPFLNKFGKYFKLTPPVIKYLEQKFHTNEAKILLISKVTLGLGFGIGILICAGILRVNFKKYIALNLIGGIFWALLLLSVGYFFGNVYQLLAGIAKIIFIPLLIIAVVAVLCVMNKIIKKVSEDSATT